MLLIVYTFNIHKYIYNYIFIPHLRPIFRKPKRMRIFYAKFVLIQLIYCKFMNAVEFNTIFLVCTVFQTCLSVTPKSCTTGETLITKTGFTVLYTSTKRHNDLLVSKRDKTLFARSYACSFEPIAGSIIRNSCLNCENEQYWRKYSTSQNTSNLVQYIKYNMWQLFKKLKISTVLSDFSIAIEIQDFKNFFSLFWFNAFLRQSKKKLLSCYRSRLRNTDCSVCYIINNWII